MRTTFAFLLAFALGHTAQATVTLNLSAGTLYRADGTTPLPLGSTIVLLADADNDHSFGDLTKATTSFTNDSGDIVLARFGSNDFLGTPGTVLQDLMLNAPLLAGLDMLLVWYDTPFNALATGPGNGTAFGTFRTDSVVDFSSLGWFVPEDPGTYALNFNTIAQLGSSPESAGVTNQVAVLPEPSTVVMLFAGCIGLLTTRKSKTSDA